jgi:dipeptidyl aminopeptidase/acylaminoacyl peptidase
MKRTVVLWIGIAAAVILSGSVQAKLTSEDYRRADSLRTKTEGLVYKARVEANWLENGPRFWYRNDLKGGTKEFILVNAEKCTKQAAFDHKKVAEALSQAAGKQFESDKLPFNDFKFVEDGNALEFNAERAKWKCDVNSYQCTKIGDMNDAEVQRSQQPGRGRGFGRRSPFGQQPPAGIVEDKPVKSPDGNWEVYSKDYNLYMRSTLTSEVYQLTSDGSADSFYSGKRDNVMWSPNSKKFQTVIVKPAPKRVIHYIESSPNDQVQPKYHDFEYEKPGDPITIEKPRLFDVETKKQVEVSDKLFPNPYYGMENYQWKPDSSEFYFYYNQRGHQAGRVIAVNADTGQTRIVVDEKSDTFIDYSGKKYLTYLIDTNELVWSSERDGWNHLYLYDIRTGSVKNQITKGQWVWRRVDKIDKEKRQLWFQASGYYKDQDPYFIHYFRVNFDGSGLVELTKGNGTHTIRYSPDRKYYVDTYSRVDMPPVSELMRAEDGSLVCEIEKADASDLLATGWKAPESLVSMSRDDRFEIWGVIYRPTNFDPNKKYPVIEDIYAGPQDSFVPKSWRNFYNQQSLAELGFIVVQIDGMGTSNRCRDFHHFAFKNLGDAGLPDRIKWMKKAAEKYPYMDITRVGVYGTSAGGQSSTGAVLFHPEFYKVAVSSCGCHDNRMDKLWWNEQWMSYPIGQEYAEQSNVTNAGKLQGKLMLIVGEMDHNVDPSSTMQVVNALIKAKKDFDLIVVPGMDHSDGGSYGGRRRRDFFVRHLLGEETPDWNAEVKEEQNNN